jgi:hypothetical protein
MVASRIETPNSGDLEAALRGLRRVHQADALGTAEQTDQNDALDFGRNDYFAPSIVPRDPTLGQNEETSAENIASSKSSLGKRVAGAIVGSTIIATVALFAWQAYSNDRAQNTVKAWWSSFPSKKLKPSSDLAVNIAAKSSDQKATEPPPAPTPVVAEVPPEVLQQLQTIVSDLAVLRHTIEEIASKQDQTSRDVESIEAAEQNLSKQISSLARVTAVRPAAQKSSHTQTPKQSTAAIPAPQPERPPLPVPAARTAAPAN